MHNNSGKQIAHCLRTLDNFVLTGNCLIAEIYRLSLTTPDDFMNPSNSAFSKFLIDFSYFENKDSFDNFVENTEEGRQLDEKFFHSFSSFLRDFARFLNKFYIFLNDFVDFTADFHTYREQFSRLKRLEELELLGSQLLYLLGLLLLLMDFKFSGSQRERIFVALYRLRLVHLESHKLQTLVDLLRNRREPFETSFSTLGLDEYFLSQIFTFLRFYKQGSRHGWLENALYVCLYFEPNHDTLNCQFSVMRQIIDTFFADRWVLHLHIDFRVNLYEKWDRFKAANAALSSSIELNKTPKLEHLRACASQLPTAGLLSLEMFGEYEKTMVEMNSRLRWLILHSSSTASFAGNKKLAAATANIMSKDAQKELLITLKQLAHFEFKFGQAAAHLRANREESLNRLRQRIGDNFSQILAFLRNSPTTAMALGPMGTANRRTERFISWLESIRGSIEEIVSSSSSDSNLALQQLDHLRSRISEVLQLQTAGGSGDGLSQSSDQQQQLILRQSLLMAHADLQRLQNVISLDAAAIEELAERTDSTYLFRFVDEHRDEMEHLLEEDALSVKYIFLKIANSISTTALTYGKIVEEKRKQLASFYYKLLELRLRSVIQAIPRAIFEEMSKLNQYFSTDTKSVFVEKAKIREFADLPRRRKLAELTHGIAKLAQGIANTCLKQLGDVQIQPRALLCDGLRAELAKRLLAILSSTVSGGHQTTTTVIFGALRAQHVQLGQFRKAFLFVCDHVGIPDGVQIWAEQLNATMNAILAKNFGKATAATKTQINPSTSASAITAFPAQPEMIVERFVEYAIAATKPTIYSYNSMEGSWHTTSPSTAIQSNSKFQYTAFACLDVWMLFGTVNFIGLMLHKEAQQLAKMLNRNFGASSIGNLQQQQVPPPLYNPAKLRKFLSTFTNDFAIDGPNRELLQSLARLGQLRLLLGNLQIFLEAEAHSQLGVVHRARRTYQRSIEFKNGHENMHDMTTLRPTEILDFLPKFVHLKHAKCHFLLLNIILYFSMFGSKSMNTKKREFLDGFAVIQGASLFLEHSPLWRRILTDSEWQISAATAVKTTGSREKSSRIPTTFLLLNFTHIRPSPNALTNQ